MLYVENNPKLVVLKLTFTYNSDLQKIKVSLTCDVDIDSSEGS